VDYGEQHIKEGGFASYGGCPDGLVEGPSRYDTRTWNRFPTCDI